MVDRKLYKTKLCVLFERGRCTRQYCNFAHGTTELRGSFNGRRDYRDGRDLRERLDRRRSPSHQSIERGDARTYSSRGNSPHSAGKRKRKQIDDQSDQSGRFSDGTDDQDKERKTSSDAQLRIREQLQEVQSEIKMGERKKRELEAYLEARSKEADTLSVNINELEMQLLKEKDECKRLTTKIKKFLKAHHRYLRLKDELKRSQGQFQKLAEQLELDVAGPVIDDGPKINAYIDNARNVHAVSPLHDSQINSSPLQRRARVRTDYDAQNQVGERFETGKHRVESAPRQPSYPDQFKSSRMSELDYDAHNGNGYLIRKHMSNREIQPPDTASSGKYKVYETAKLPSTGIASRAMNEENDGVEPDDKPPVGATVAEVKAEGSVKTPTLPFLPPLPPPVPENAYAQYKGEEETVDIDGVDEDAVDIV